MSWWNPSTWFSPKPMTLPSKLPWTATIEGDDLVVRNIFSTCFGGKYDAGDTGETESGYDNRGDGTAQANSFQVALPIRSTEAATKSSPLAFSGPHIPWGTSVMVWLEANGEATAVEATLTDNGPDVSVYPTHALDCNPPLALHFSPLANPRLIANTWSKSGVSYRIIGGAKYVS